MNDSILIHQQSWRYCRVRTGEKKPYPANWQNNPLTLEQVDSKNIGLILGPLGNGVCAIDFDGTTAWTWARLQGIDIALLNSIAWTSGKTDRCQMAFYVPRVYWPWLKTKKIATGAGEGFEFRWAGGQSVLPPSIHPDTHKPYEWLIDATNNLQTIPDSVLTAWLLQILQQQPKVLDTTPEVNIEDLTDSDIQLVEHALAMLKQRSPVLSYDLWTRVSWAVAHELGTPVAQVVLQKYYPEQKSGEYNTLFRNYNKGLSPTIGSLMFMAGIKKTNIKELVVARRREYLQEQTTRKKLKI